MELVILERPTVSLFFPTIMENSILMSLFTLEVSHKSADFIISIMDHDHANINIDIKADKEFMDMMQKYPNDFTEMINDIEIDKLSLYKIINNNKLLKIDLLNCFKTNIQKSIEKNIIKICKNIETKITKIKGLIIPEGNCYMDNCILHKYRKLYNWINSSYAKLLNKENVFRQECRSKSMKCSKLKV